MTTVLYFPWGQMYVLAEFHWAVEHGVDISARSAAADFWDGEDEVKKEEIIGKDSDEEVDSFDRPAAHPKRRPSMAKGSSRYFTFASD